MKVVIQIPCFREETTLPATLHDLPERLPGVDEIEVLIIDDASPDATSTVAQACGAHRVVRLSRHEGLARTFSRGLQEALAMGADVIVNTDGDNQYPGDQIGELIAPILRGEADIVIGARDTSSIRHFSRTKRAMQRIGSRTVRALTGCPVTDATSGFRAFRREVAGRLTFVTHFSHTLETLVQAPGKKLVVREIPIRTNAKTRESRLSPSSAHFVLRALGSLARTCLHYHPFRARLVAGGGLALLGICLGVMPIAGGAGEPAASSPAMLLGGALLLAGIVLGGKTLFGQRFPRFPGSRPRTVPVEIRRGRDRS